MLHKSLLHIFFQRLINGIATLLLVLVLGFGLNKNRQGDPVERLYRVENTDGLNPNPVLYEYYRHQMGLDLPLFYISFQDNAFQWHGGANQLHRWLSQYASLNLGVSYVDGLPIRQKLWLPLLTSLLLTFLSLGVAYIVAIPLGIWSALQADKAIEKSLTVGLLILHCVPIFGFGTLFLLLFSKVGFSPLPVLCLVLHSLVVVSRQVQMAVIAEWQRAYIVTARAKGLTLWQTMRLHAFRNAAFPLITFLGQAFPATLMGSLTVEIIFNLNGMGRLAYDALLQHDEPMIYALLLLGTILTLLGNAIADTLYYWANPTLKTA